MSKDERVEGKRGSEERENGQGVKRERRKDEGK